MFELMIEYNIGDMRFTIHADSDGEYITPYEVRPANEKALDCWSQPMDWSLWENIYQPHADRVKELLIRELESALRAEKETDEDARAELAMDDQ